MPLVAGTSDLRITASRELGDRRVVCNLATADGTRLVGLYAVDAGRIIAACHYFSDMDMLERIGVLPAPAGVTAVPREANGSPPALSLADGLLARRLSHRRERVQLVIHALDQRIRELNGGGQPVPGALTAAIRGFQEELDRIDAQHPSRGG